MVNWFWSLSVYAEMALLLLLVPASILAAAALWTTDGRRK